jgi:UMF1 family MFS transporter
MSPILSSIADYKGNKKSFMHFFLTIGSMACAGLFFFNSSNQLGWGILCMIIACIGFWSSLVFYNSYLPEIAAPQDRDSVSARGFAMGYIGSVILQIICFVFVFKPELIGGNDLSTIQFRLSFLLVGIWWWSFGQFSLSRLPKGNKSADSSNRKNLIINGYSELLKVWQQLKHLSVLKRFLFSFFFYNMGVQTVMLAATLYGKSELQIPTSNLIIAILIIQVIAIPGAFIISKLSSVIGNFKALMLCVIVWIFLCIAGYLLPAKGINQFYALAVMVGFVMGGIQSLSRSTYSKIMPSTRDTTSFFSFFDVTEKIAIVIGMFSFGYITEMTGSQRNSVLVLVVFFFIGLIGLFFTQQKKNNLSVLS